MLKRLLIVTLLLIPALSFGQSKSIKQFYPFATSYDSTRTILMLCEKPEQTTRYPSHLMTPFQVWLTNLPLLPEGSPVTDWQGNVIKKVKTDGIIDYPITSKYQTDADILVMLALNFFSLDSTIYGFNVVLDRRDTVNYSKWLIRDYHGGQGESITYTERDTPKTDNRKEFEKYLDFVTRHFDEQTVMLNAAVVPHNHIKPGNMYVQFSDDSLKVVSHVALVLDVVRNPGKQLSVLVAYGGNPAQSFVVPNIYGETDAKWFTVPELVEFMKQYGEGFFYRYTN